MVTAVTKGISKLADRINLPIRITVEKGNLNDQTHFKNTYHQINNRLRKGSLVVFDKGTNSLENTALIRADEM